MAMGSRGVGIGNNVKMEVDHRIDSGVCMNILKLILNLI